MIDNSSRRPLIFAISFGQQFCPIWETYLSGKPSDDNVFVLCILSYLSSGVLPTQVLPRKIHISDYDLTTCTPAQRTVDLRGVHIFEIKKAILQVSRYPINHFHPKPHNSPPNQKKAINQNIYIERNKERHTRHYSCSAALLLMSSPCRDPRRPYAHCRRTPPSHMRTTQHSV